MIRKTVLLDCDGPLTNTFVMDACQHLRNLGYDAWPHTLKDWGMFEGVGATYADQEKVYDQFRVLGVAQTFHPRPGAKEFVTYLREWSEVYAVTAPLDNAPTWMYDREVWLYNHFGIKPVNVIHARSKHLVKGDVLIDDRLSTLRTWKIRHPEGLPILWTEDYNREAYWSGARAGSFNELIDILETVRK